MLMYISLLCSVHVVVQLILPFLDRVYIFMTTIFIAINVCEKIGEETGGNPSDWSKLTFCFWLSIS